jgi:hypothetical protein
MSGLERSRIRRRRNEAVFVVFPFFFAFDEARERGSGRGEGDGALNELHNRIACDRKTIREGEGRLERGDGEKKE